MFDQPSELLSINYFLEQNRALARGSKSAPHQSVIPISIGSYPQTNFDNIVSEMAMGKNISLPRHGSAENDGGSNKKVAIGLPNSFLLKNIGLVIFKLKTRKLEISPCECL
jgi:hypothetical protein